MHPASYLANAQLPVHTSQVLCCRLLDAWRASLRRVQAPWSPVDKSEMPKIKGPKKAGQGSPAYSVKSPSLKPDASLKPSDELHKLELKRKQLAEELQNVEKQIYDLETRYLSHSNPHGNAIKGYTGFLTSGMATVHKVAPKAADRLFSDSSVTGLSDK